MPQPRCKKCGQEHFDGPELAAWCSSCFVHFDEFERLVLLEWDTPQCLDDASRVVGLIQFACLSMMGLSPAGIDPTDVVELERWVVPIVLHQLRHFVATEGSNYRQAQLLQPIPLAAVNVTINEGCRWLQWSRG